MIVKMTIQFFTMVAEIVVVLMSIELHMFEWYIAFVAHEMAWMVVFAVRRNHSTTIQVLVTICTCQATVDL